MQIQRFILLNYDYFVRKGCNVKRVILLKCFDLAQLSFSYAYGQCKPRILSSFECIKVSDFDFKKKKTSKNTNLNYEYGMHKHISVDNNLEKGKHSFYFNNIKIIEFPPIRL